MHSILTLILERKKNQTTLRHKFVGRMDAVCNNLVIEYKKLEKLDKEKDKEKATEQLTDYLLQLRRRRKRISRRIN